MSQLIFPTTILEAQKAVGEIRAGGTDITERRHHISQGQVVDLHHLPGLDQVRPLANGRWQIGARVTIEEVANHPQLQQFYPGLSQAAGALATPQIRAIATMGGALLQKTRCWYYRHEHFSCYKKGGDSCPARPGDHRFGVVFDSSPCVAPHPSTLGLALMVYGAMVEINGEEERPVTALYGDGRDPSRDHLLAAGEILTHIILPPPVAHEKASYFRSISRARAEWPLVEVSVRLVVDEQNVITLVSVGMGGVASVPLLLPQVNQALVGQLATEETFQAAAKLATAGANPLPQTGYKVPLVSGTVLEALLQAGGK